MPLLKFWREAGLGRFFFQSFRLLLDKFYIRLIPRFLLDINLGGLTFFFSNRMAHKDFFDRIHPCDGIFTTTIKLDNQGFLPYRFLALQFRLCPIDGMGLTAGNLLAFFFGICLYFRMTLNHRRNCRLASGKTEAQNNPKNHRRKLYIRQTV